MSHGNQSRRNYTTEHGVSKPDPKTTLREFHEYFARSYESHSKIAARIGVSQWAIWNWLTGKQLPAAKSLARLRAFLDAETKRPVHGDGIRPIECVPYKIIKPIQQVRYARLCPFCRKARGKICKLRASLFQGICPSAERPGRRAKHTRKPCELGMGENDGFSARNPATSPGSTAALNASRMERRKTLIRRLNQFANKGAPVKSRIETRLPSS